MMVPYLYIYHHITSDPIKSSVISFPATREEQEEEAEEGIGSSSSGKKRKRSPNTPDFNKLADILFKRYPERNEKTIPAVRKLYHFPCLAVQGVPNLKKGIRKEATEDCLASFVKYFEEEKNDGWLNANSYLKNTWCQPNDAEKIVGEYDKTKKYLLTFNSPSLGHRV
jgi:hypothetical protein